jgi:hypothetical protein
VCSMIYQVWPECEAELKYLGLTPRGIEPYRYASLVPMPLATSYREGFWLGCSAAWNKLRPDYSKMEGLEEGEFIRAVITARLTGKLDQTPKFLRSVVVDMLLFR